MSSESPGVDPAGREVADEDEDADEAEDRELLLADPRGLPSPLFAVVTILASTRLAMASMLGSAGFSF